MDWSGPVPGHYTEGQGIGIGGSDVEIDNNQIWGFAHSAVGGGSNIHVHHNYIHHNSRTGLGYGVTAADDSIIEYNHFNHNRHSVAGSGDESYTARYNYVGPRSISHIFDMHEPGGETIKIHHNTVRAVEQDDDNKNTPAVTIRGTPSDVADIHHNWIYNTEEPCASPGSWPGCAILQTQHGSSSFQNVEFSSNHYGETEPDSCDIGAPRDGCQ
jgi:hypothetical protein